MLALAVFCSSQVLSCAFTVDYIRAFLLNISSFFSHCASHCIIIPFIIFSPFCLNHLFMSFFGVYLSFPLFLLFQCSLFFFFYIHSLFFYLLSSVHFSSFLLFLHSIPFQWPSSCLSNVLNFLLILSYYFLLFLYSLTLCLRPSHLPFYLLAFFVRPVFVSFFSLSHLFFLFTLYILI